MELLRQHIRTIRKIKQQINDDATWHKRHELLTQVVSRIVLHFTYHGNETAANKPKSVPDRVECVGPMPAWKRTLETWSADLRPPWRGHRRRRAKQRQRWQTPPRLEGAAAGSDSEFSRRACPPRQAPKGAACKQAG